MRKETRITGLTIGALARRVGIPVTTVRYYERTGLLRPKGRTRGGFRLYDGRSVEVARFIRQAKGMGLSLVDAGTLLSLRAANDRGAKARRGLLGILERRLRDCEGRLAAMRSRRGILLRAVKMCRDGGTGARCPLLRRLGSIPA